MKTQHGQNKTKQTNKQTNSAEVQLLQKERIPHAPQRDGRGPLGGHGVAPADHSVDGILHGQLQLEGGLGLLFSPEEDEDPSWQVPQGRRLRGSGRCPEPGPAHLLTLATRSSLSPRVAVGET